MVIMLKNWLSIQTALQLSVRPPLKERNKTLFTLIINRKEDTLHHNECKHAVKIQYIISLLVPFYWKRRGEKLVEFCRCKKKRREKEKVVEFCCCKQSALHGNDLLINNCSGEEHILGLGSFAVLVRAFEIGLGFVLVLVCTINHLGAGLLDHGLLGGASALGVLSLEKDLGFEVCVGFQHIKLGLILAASDDLPASLAVAKLLLLLCIIKW